MYVTRHEVAFVAVKRSRSKFLRRHPSAIGHIRIGHFQKKTDERVFELRAHETPS